MKKQIRKSVFETNSSSMHALAIKRDKSIKDIFDLYKGIQLEIRGGEFGWEAVVYNDYQTKADYVWTLFVTDNDLTRVNMNISRLTEILEQHEISVSYAYPIVEDRGGWIRAYPYKCAKKYFDGYIDHQSYNLQKFMDMSDEELFRFIFDDQIFLITGNDNEFDEAEAIWQTYIDDGYDVKEI